MKSRNFWTIIILVVLLCSILIWLKQRHSHDGNETTVANQETIVAKSNDTPSTSTSEPVTGSKSMASPSTSGVTGTTPESRRLEQLAAAPNSKNIPITFYGRVMDQDGNPLSGVRVTGSVRQWYYVAPVGISARYPKTTVTTGQDGQFEFADGSGDDLKIEAIDKDGYMAEPQSLRDFGCNISENHTPNQISPVVFTMWKAGTEQKLISGNRFFSITPDGRFFTLDLLTGTLKEGKDEGDLRVWIKRPEGVKFGQHHDWSCGIEAIDGGLLSEGDGYASMFLAPSDGYKANFQLARLKTDEQWGDSSGTRRFYLKSRNGRVFGRAEIEVFSVYSPSKPESRFRIKYAVNPAGSRVLHE